MGKLNPWLGVAVALALGACAKSGAGGGAGLPSDALETAIGGTIGDPTTCVLVVDQASHKTLYQYGQSFNCARPYPACDRPGSLTAKTAIPLAANGGRAASCVLPSGDSVGWAEGPTAVPKRSLMYSAVMSGPRALPGHEIAARLADVFSNVGL